LYSSNREKQIEEVLVDLGNHPEEQEMNGSMIKGKIDDQGETSS